MDWDTLLYMSIAGVAVTMGLVFLITTLGIRYRSELPKLPIVDSIQALELEQEKQEGNLADLRSKVGEAQEQIGKGERWRDWLEQKEDEINQVKQELLELAQQKEEVERIKSELEYFRTKVAEATSTLEESEYKRQGSKLEVERLERRLEELEQKRQALEEVERKLPGLEMRNTQLQTDLSDLTAKIDNLKGKYEELQAKTGEMKGKVTGLQVEEARLLASIKEIKQGLEESEQGQQTLGELYIPYFSERHDAGGSNEETYRLGQTGHSLQRAGIRLPQRILYAFHTALKIQDISPFTVMAGISGTGKSLLPTVYARCMGLSFINLPVQPSWNSPQDLFGFYNYMEHKYKATPLAQALLQFSQDQDKAPSKVELKDQVLLVLLDEMNLARVEYYFSELLSRLELRRSIDPADRKDRRQVAIPLDIPGMGEADTKGIHIYPSSNVLFCGTMNEDESTLSLSDKVLDRATILRFGRPQRLLDKQPDTGQLQSPQPLAHDVWKEWCDTGGKSVPEGMSKHIHETLPGIMGDLGSPLGHRGAQSITQYLLLYPKQGVTSWKHALADQIEQKILPKVRGKEIRLIEGPMKDLIALVNNLEDRELAEAMDKGMRDSQGIFMWNGLDRKDT